MRRRRRASLAVSALLGFALAASPASARTFGLVFGVSDYPALPPEKWLKAPKNDVQRMMKALAALGVAGSDLTIIADGVDGAKALPLRAEILAALDGLASAARSGDFVVIYGSGHGSRQRARSGAKIDGLDQLFLPRDVEPDATMASGGAFRNAIVSFEFGAVLDAIRRKGADVLFILDSCFSGSASRAIGDGVHDKMIDPADVGLSVATALEPDQRKVLAEAAPLPAGSGRLVALYASQPNETAREVALPASAPIERRSWGSIFTLALTDVLTQNRGLTWRQAMVEAGRRLRADPSFQARQTPSYEGDGLDQPAFGSNASPVAPGWRVADGILHAGRLDGVEDGAILSLLDGADASKPIGAARVSRADALQSVLVMLKPGCEPVAATCAVDDRNPVPAKAIYARLARPAPGRQLRLSSLRPWTGTAVPPALAARWSADLAAVLSGPLNGLVTVDDAAPDLVAWADEAGIRLMPNGTAPDRMEAGPALGAAARDGETPPTALARALLRARQTTGLQQLVETAGAGAGRELDVTVETRRYGLDDKTRQCRFAGNEGTPLGEGEPVMPCDKLVVTLENRGRRTLLPMVFFLDDGWNFIARRPSCPIGLTVADRLDQGRRLILEVPYQPRAFTPGRSPLTTNGVLVIGVPFREGETELPNLCGLTAYNDGPVQTRRAVDGLADLDGLIGGSTRGGKRLELDSAALSLVFWPVSQPPK